MTSDGTPDRGSLTPQEWNRVTQDLLSLSVVVTDRLPAVAGTGKGSDKNVVSGLS